MLTGQWVGSTGQQNKAASAGQMHRRKDSRKHQCVITDGSRLLFSGCACYNSTGKREKTLTFPSILKRMSVNLAHRYKGKC